MGGWMGRRGCQALRELPGRLEAPGLREALDLMVRVEVQDLLATPDLPELTGKTVAPALLDPRIA
jgi:hypothetical protein